MMNLHERRSRALTYLAEVTHALSATEAMEAVLSLIVDRIAVLFASEAVAILGLAPNAEEFVLLAARQSTNAFPLSRDLTFPRPGTLLDRALSERTALALSSKGPEILDPMVQTLLDGRHLEGGYIVPLRAAGAERGGLILVNPRSVGDAAEALRDLVTFADLSAMAIDRTRLGRTHSDEATHLRVLNAVLQVTSAGLDEETLIRRAMEALLAGTPADRVELLTLEGDELRQRYHYSHNRDHPRAERAEQGRRRWHRRVIMEGIGSIESAGQGDHLMAEEPYQICVPLPAENAIVGSLFLGRRSAPYEEHDLEILGAIGGHIGVAIALSRLIRRQAATAESLERALAESAAALNEARERLAGEEEERARIQSLASLGELAAGVAHDLNNALNPVVAFAELIQEHCDQPERVQMYADRILLAARGGAETVRRIKRFTRRRLGAVPFEPISVSALVHEVIDLTQPTWSKRPTGSLIRVEESVEEDLLVQGNPGELRQALLNLVGNSLDAMPGGGTLRFVARAEDEEVVLAVQDTGSGMSRSVFERALEPFFTTKGAHGTGLGLAEVFGIARRHGGSLELESHERMGTTVLLRLPRTRALPVPVKVRRKLTGAATKLHHILLVDDSLLGLEAIATSLRAAGHTVATAPNADSALRIFNAGHYDLVLSDLALPDMHGLELVERLKRLDPQLRVGVITGWSFSGGEDELRQRGVDLFFVKPVDSDQLLAAI
jgi:signal transduction histidine kinase